MDACEKEESKLDLEDLIAHAIAHTERMVVYGKDIPERRKEADI